MKRSKPRKVTLSNKGENKQPVFEKPDFSVSLLPEEVKFLDQPCAFYTP